MAKKTPKGIYVGRFNEEDITNGIDKKATQEKMSETGLKYTNTRYVIKKGQIVALDVWVCNAEDFELL